jgi:tetratricopeptide (TPR) repeat protein
VTTTPSILAFLALFGWAPVTLALFLLLPARRAMVVGAISAWLLLPPLSFDLPGLPEYNKATAATLGILLGTLIFEPWRFIAFRPRWIDLPILVWCLCPYVTSIQNNLGAYDGLSATFRQSVSWLFPYFIGRLYLTDLDGLREMAFGMVIGGLCLIPFCLFEIRMSPQLMPLVYGMGGWEGTRLGGYRPRVFFKAGLELGLWMNAVTLVAWWLWRCGQLKRLWTMSGGLIVSVLAIMSLLCRTTGASFLLLAGLFSLWYCCRTKSKWVMWGLMFIAPLYYAVRIPDLWSGQQAVNVIRMLGGEDRAWSLQFRLENENLFIAKALQRPFFGWGGWQRSLVFNEWHHQVSFPDGLWIIAFAGNGYVGLVSMTAALLAPVVVFLRRFPVERWTQPDFAPATTIAVILNLYTLDGLSNAMLNMIYIIAAGGLANIVSAGPIQRSGRLKGERDSAAIMPGSRLELSSRSANPSRVMLGLAGATAAQPESLATRYQALGRSLKTQGQLSEAKVAWLRALDLFDKQTPTGPERKAPLKEWCDCANDLAWLLVSAPDPAVRDPVHAAQLAGLAIEAHPECSTYWNTLGAAQYRAGDFEAAVASFDRSTALADGGTAFDHFFLAMAHTQLGNQDQARHWFTEATTWIERSRHCSHELLQLRSEASEFLSADAESTRSIR